MKSVSILSAIFVLGLCTAANALTVNSSERCSESVVDHDGTIDSSCQLQGHTFGCYDVVEITCEKDGKQTRQERENRMNGKCGDSYSDCW